jgi:hypothetical protein
MTYAIILSNGNNSPKVLASIQAANAAEAYNELRQVIDRQSVEQFGRQLRFRSSRSGFLGYIFDDCSGSQLILDNLDKPEFLSTNEVKNLTK